MNLSQFMFLLGVIIAFGLMIFGGVLGGVTFANLLGNVKGKIPLLVTIDWLAMLSLFTALTRWNDMNTQSIVLNIFIVICFFVIGILSFISNIRYLSKQ